MLLTNMLLASALAFDAGADLRIRQELIEHAPGLPNGTFFRGVASDYRHHIRFRPRVWGEVKGNAGEYGAWRLYTRFADEFRWNTRPSNSTTAWPGELIVDNLFVEGKGIYDGFLDLKVGRQDLFGYCNLDHILVDGTPGDGSRTMYTDMASARLNFEDESTLDFFGLYNFDSNGDFRLGDDEHRISSLSARVPDGSGDQDDWGAGVVWGSQFAKDFRYQLFAIEKVMLHQEDTHTDLVGTRLMPRFTRTVSGNFEAMSQLNGEWSGFAEIIWKSARAGVKPFVKAAYRYLSGEWDPMWDRDALESELYLYGSNNGIGWWSNQHYLKLTAGLEFAPKHEVWVSTGPIFAAEADDLGGGGGDFKGLYSRAMYTFPLWTPNREAGERFEVFGHLLAELLNPGDYYESDRPGWFLRWQVDFRF